MNEWFDFLFELNIELNVFFSIIQRSIEFLKSIVQGYVEEVLKKLTYFVDVEEVLRKAPTIMSVKFRCLHVALFIGKD